MGVYHNGRYNSVSEIKGPSGWYYINTPLGPVHTYVNQDYDGGGWVLVMANRANTKGMTNLSYVDAVNNCNIRTIDSVSGLNTVVPIGTKLKTLADYNIWVGTKYWSLLSGRLSTDKITVVQFVSPTNGIALNRGHAKRHRWQFDSFNDRYGMLNAVSIGSETASDLPGFYSYHAVNNCDLTTFDRDQDSYPTNCSALYNNNPWWYEACWSGSYFGGGGGANYTDSAYWTSSGADYYQYGAVYIK